MRHSLRNVTLVCGTILLMGGCAQGEPPERPERPTAGESERPPRREGNEPSPRAEKASTVTGIVKSVRSNRDGDVDALELEDGTEVRFPPNAGAKLSGIVSAKDRITVEGWVNAGESEVHAATIKNETSGKTIQVDHPPPGINHDIQEPRRQGASNDEADDQRRPARREDDGPSPRGRSEARDRRPERQEQGKRYSLEQATSDRAQLHTIAFDGLAFLTGDFGMDTFLPPGKVSDYFGFQYMRDIDAKGGGHNTSFLTRIAFNMLATLNSDQKAQLLTLAKQQQSDIRRFAEMRLPLIKAFRRNLEGDLPAGSNGLDRNAVIQYSAKLYELDGRLTFDRAKVMGGILYGLTAEQKSALAKLKFGDSRTWPDLPEQLDKRSMSHEVNVAVMTYASEMFAWYAGSLEADTYFCPERHGMYFGGFGMKTAPAMGKKDYSISTTLTGDSGEAFVATLTEPQRKHITDLPGLQRRDLAEIVKIRREIATELRRFQRGESADQDKVLSMSRRYGELDGEMSYLYATAFAKVGQSLTAEQKATLAKKRTSNPSDPKGPFLYSTPIRTPKIENTEFLFGGR
jgi:Spy/CpxP family protein refolding chaperone